MDCNVWSIVLKYGGRWTEVRGQNRTKYVGGSQKTIKIDRSCINLIFLKERTEAICHWIRGHAFEMHSHISGTSPKKYMPILSDNDVIDMLSSSCSTNKVEVVVVVEDQVEDMSNMNCTEHGHLTANNTMVNDFLVEDLCDGSFSVGLEENKGLYVCLQFDNASCFKQAVRSNAILNNFAIKIKVSDKSRVIGTCMHRGCPWRVRASLCSDGQSFEVRKLNSVHLCPGVSRAGNKQATSSWIAEEIKDIVKRNPEVTSKDIANKIEADFGLSLPYMKIWRSREIARDLLFGSIDDNYKWVPTLRHELISRNPGSHITYQCDNQNQAFKRFFVSFKVCIDGYLAGCRFLIGVDACHLKSKYLGVLLSANCLDGNNGLYTIAFVVAESESRRSWEWFLINLREAFNVQFKYLAFISDMEKGLGEAIKSVFPNTEHRVCMRHLWKNLKKHFHCDDSHALQKLVWTAANCFSILELNSKVEQILHVNPHVHSYLTALTCKWSKATFQHQIKNHYNTNNMSESFNAWVEDARNKPVVDLIDMIRGHVMEQRSQRKINANTWRGPLVPCVYEFIREVTTTKEQFIIRQSTSTRAEVEGLLERHEIDIEKRTCTCAFWQIAGLPCKHVAAFVGTQQHILWHTYVDEVYYSFRYRMAYEGAISTLPWKDQWSEQMGLVLPPASLRPRGRPKKRRMKNFLEGSQTSKKQHRCGRCNMWGHYRSSCKEPLHRNVVVDDQVVAEKIPFRRTTCNPTPTETT